MFNSTNHIYFTHRTINLICNYHCRKEVVQMILKITNISKSYGNNLALNKFTSILEPGIYALLGL